MKCLLRLLLAAVMCGAVVHPVCAQPDVLAPQGTDPVRPDAGYVEDAIDESLVQRSLATFKFEGVQLGSSPDELLSKFPKAERIDNPRGAASGVVGYAVQPLVVADSARFYFVDGRLYQIEIHYGRERIYKSGGFDAIVRKLVTQFGNADNIYRNRRTWHQRAVSRRADFYTSESGAQLLITDTNQRARFEARQKQAVVDGNVKLGF